jgi:hypothetical protein
MVEDTAAERDLEERISALEEEVKRHSERSDPPARSRRGVLAGLGASGLAGLLVGSRPATASNHASSKVDPTDTLRTDDLELVPEGRSEHTHRFSAEYDPSWWVPDSWVSLVTESPSSAETRGSGYLFLDEGVSLGKRYNDGKGPAGYEMLKNFGNNVFLENEIPGGRVGIEAGADQNIVINRRDSNGNKSTVMNVPADGSDIGRSFFNVYDEFRTFGSSIGIKNDSGRTRTLYALNDGANFARFQFDGNNVVFLKRDRLQLRRRLDVNENPAVGLREISNPSADDLESQEWAWDSSDDRWLYKDSSGTVHHFSPDGTL